MIDIAALPEASELPEGAELDDSAWTVRNSDLAEMLYNGNSKIQPSSRLEVSETTYGTGNSVWSYENASLSDTTNTYHLYIKVKAEKVEVPVTKTWDDSNNQDGIQPGSVTVKLLADGVDTGKTVTLSEKNQWSDTFTDLAKNKDGQEIVYTVEETAVTGYTVAITGDVETGFAVKNTHIPETIDIPVTKTWDDADNQDGIQPGSVTVKLLADGVDTGKTVTLSEKNQWSDSFKDLAKYKAKGTEIVYTVEEVEVTGYTAAITGDVENGFTITNTHTPETIEIPVTKVWDDADNQDGIQPGSVTVKLLADGADTGKTVTLSEKNQWSDSFTDLAKNKDGQEIVYTVEEAAVTGYTTAITGDVENGFTVTNTHTPETIEIPVTKVWDDADNQDGIQPGSVTVKLLADGADTGKTVTLSEKNQWSDSFKDLAKYKAKGTEIVYTVEEAAVTGYTAAITGDVENGFTITNTHTPETMPRASVLQASPSVCTQTALRSPPRW